MQFPRASATVLKILVRDADLAKEFYVDKFGFEDHEDVTFGDYRWLTLRLPGDTFEINLEPAVTDEQRAAVGHQTPGLPMIGIQTDDAHAVHRVLTEKGVDVVKPQVHPYGTDVQATDLYGNIINWHQDA